jgi:hypothetical protein
MSISNVKLMNDYLNLELNAIIDSPMICVILDF